MIEAGDRERGMIEAGVLGGGTSWKVGVPARPLWLTELP